MIRRALLALLLAPLLAWGQLQPSSTQIATLRTAVLAEPTLAAARNAGDDAAIAAWCNTIASPDFYAWRATMSTAEIGLLVNYVAVAAMTTANLDRVKAFYTLNPASFDPGRSDIRTFLADTFSGALGGQGQATRDALDAAYRLKLTRAEKLIATGTGSFADPAIAGWTGSITTSTASLLR